MGDRIVLQPVEYARQAVDISEDMQASDIVLLDIRGVSDFADYFVIMTADSPRQINALAEDLDKALGARGAALHHREGSPQGGWVLLDYIDVIVHVFLPEEREFYHIEGAWPEAIEIVRIL